MSDLDVRREIYRHFVEEGEPPSVPQVAAALGLAAEEAAAAFRRLAADHLLVLVPGTLEVWMAHPLSAVETAYRVDAQRGEWWANCIWDALGIPAMLGEDATVATACPDCGEAMELRVRGGALEPAEGVVHFAVPARRWWDDIGFT